MTSATRVARVSLPVSSWSINVLGKGKHGGIAGHRGGLSYLLPLVWIWSKLLFC